MPSNTYPFPLAARSSHHSHYHRFLLGADASILDPMPKPYCVGSLAGPVRALAEPLNLQHWRRLYSGSFPWTDGYPASHYEPGLVPPHTALPQAYGRPARRYGAFDFVQIADPSVSALALVAGDRRVIERFAALGDDFCQRLEREMGGAGHRAEPGGRILAGQFFEPNNRWLMPLLHVHSRVLNFSGSDDAPQRLRCLDGALLGRAGRRASLGWEQRQAAALRDLGYRVCKEPVDGCRLGVEGVDERLLTALEAPRLAVLRLLERLVTGERPSGAGRLQAEIPAPVIAAMAGQLEDVLARSLWRFKPEKVDIPARGPWRTAVRGHLAERCPGSLRRLDEEAVRANACLFGASLLPVPLLDAAHSHAADTGEVDAPLQHATEAQLCDPPEAHLPMVPSAWLAQAFPRTLEEINAAVAADRRDPALRSLLSLSWRLNALDCSASAEQLRQSALFIAGELERREGRRRPEFNVLEAKRDDGPAPLPALAAPEWHRPRREHELAGRSL